jgi:hypothetical protein
MKSPGELSSCHFHERHKPWTHTIFCLESLGSAAAGSDKDTAACISDAIKFISEAAKQTHQVVPLTGQRHNKKNLSGSAKKKPPVDLSSDRRLHKDLPGPAKGQIKAELNGQSGDF